MSTNDNKECHVLGCNTTNPIICLSCNFTSCIKCTQTFILSQPIAKCMSCNREYSEDYLREMFPKSWMAKDYVNWKKNSLFEREKGLLPETVEYINTEKQKYIFQKFTGEKSMERFNLKIQLDTLKSEIKQNELNLKIAKKQKNKDDLEKYSNLKDTLFSNFANISKQFARVDALLPLLKNATDPYRVNQNRPNTYRNTTIENLIKLSNTKVRKIEDKKGLVTYKFTPYGIYDEEGNMIDQFGMAENKQPEEEEKQERKAFVKPCPAPNCRGFLSNKWICGLCDTIVCKDCHEIKGKKKTSSTDEDNPEIEDEKTPHVCDKNNIETAKALQKETRGCPKCGIRIFKIDGCDQMFCTGCHTPFSWTTGKIVTGVIHNPHYFQYLRQQGMQIPRADHPDANPDTRFEILCGQVADIIQINRFLQHKQNNINIDKPRQFNFILHEVSRFRNHINDIINPTYRWQRQLRTVYTPEENRDLRTKYLNKEIDDKQWNMVTMKRYKKLEYNKMISNLNQTLIAVFGDFLNNCLVIPLNTNIVTDKFFEPIYNFINYYNTESIKYTKLFGYKVNISYIEIDNISESNYRFRDTSKVIPKTTVTTSTTTLKTKTKDTSIIARKPRILKKPIKKESESESDSDDDN